MSRTTLRYYLLCEVTTMARVWMVHLLSGPHIFNDLMLHLLNNLVRLYSLIWQCIICVVPHFSRGCCRLESIILSIVHSRMRPYHRVSFMGPASILVGWLHRLTIFFFFWSSEIVSFKAHSFKMNMVVWECYSIAPWWYFIIVLNLDCSCDFTVTYVHFVESCTIIIVGSPLF